jgi:radical SAM protein
MVDLLPPRPSRLGRPAVGNFEDSPLLVFYEVTQACDLVCEHCRACAQTEAAPDELSTADARRLIDQVTEFPTPPMLVLTGGDPLKRQDIFSLVEYATESGLDVSITPSATPLMTISAIRRLRDAGISRLAVSFDGADAGTHDATRGVRGSFDRSLQILADARAVGLQTQVNTTLTPTNFGQIESMATLLAEQGILMWSVFFLVPVGRALGLPRLTTDQYEVAFARLWREAQRQPYAIKTTEAPHYRRYVIQHQVSKSERATQGGPPSYYAPLATNDGKGIMFVSHSGLVHPSGFLPIVCGVFPLENVVQVYQESPIFRALRDPGRLEGKCGDCEFRHICGGSRARAYAVTDNLFAQDPNCAYVPRVRLRAS